MITDSNTFSSTYRSSVAKSRSTKIAGNAHCVTMVVRNEDLIKEGKFYRLRNTRLEERKLFPQAKFSDDFLLRRARSCYSLGTGFFISQQVIATAAHIFFPAHEQVAFDQIRFVQGIFTEKHLSTILPHQIFRPKASKFQDCPHHMSVSNADWALIEVVSMDRRRKPTYFIPDYDTGIVHRDHRVYTIGHGLGLSSLRVKRQFADVLVNDINRPYFECNLPALTSSSGAPVFEDKTHRLIGMLIRGTNPFTLKDGIITTRENRSLFEGEECQRLAPLLVALQDLKQKNETADIL